MKSHQIAVLLAVLSMFFCATIQAQRQTPQQKQKAQKEAQERAQRLADEDAVSKMPDSGADMAFVVSLKANIREEPNRTSPILKEVARGEALSLIEREPTGTWFHVIHIDSAIEGWIDRSVIVNKFTANKYTAPAFQEERSDTYGDPIVKINNQEKYTDLNLRMNGVLYIIKADTTRTFTIPAGPYEYYGWSPGIRATFGKRTLTRGTIYSWKFFIRRR